MKFDYQCNRKKFNVFNFKTEFCSLGAGIMR